MVAPKTLRRLQAAAICATAVALMFTSLFITTTGFLAWHVFTTRPHHSIPFYFQHSKWNSTKRAFLNAYIPLHQARGLRSIRQIKASVRLVLPESRVNLENSVFYLASELYAQQDTPSPTKHVPDEYASAVMVPRPACVCLSRGTAHATLRYRSPVSRAMRAATLFVPLLLGVTKEYQTVQEDVLSYRAETGNVPLPLLDGLRIKLYPAEMQVAQASLKLRVVRSSFVSTMLHEDRLSTFLVVAIGLWYVFLFSTFMLVAVLSALRKAAMQYWRTRTTAPEDASGSASGYSSVAARDEHSQSSGARPPRMGEAGSFRDAAVPDRRHAFGSSLGKEGLRRRAGGKSFLGSR